jgi:seryl-tRNA synthetase
MLDIRFIRENKELIALAAKKKHVDFDVEALLKVDDTRREILQKVEEVRARQNQIADSVPKENDPQKRALLIEESKKAKEGLQAEEEKLKEVMKDWQGLMLCVPNIPDMSVPEGKDDSENQEVKKWGEIPNFDFTPKSHVELMQMHGMVDFDRGVKVAGFRGYFLKNDGALLQYALWRFVSDYFIKKGDFTPMIVPSLVKREVFLGTGYLPQGEEDLYKTQDGDFLAGTAEVATMGYFMDEVIDKSQLPMKFISFSPCFRREAGSHGKDTKGIMRVHEFYKFEQVIFCEASHEESVKYHEEITGFAEDILQQLEIPYHVVANCGGDLGLGQVKKYDIEAWIPSENKYRDSKADDFGIARDCRK